MTQAQRAEHLLRRFGLGGGRYELARYPDASVEGILDYLLSPKPEEPVSANEFIRQEDGNLALGPNELVGWWALRMVRTRNPLVERMTLFWHDHFPVSGEKVPDGPQMQIYLEGLRRNCLGAFPEILEAGVKTAAMLNYLDQANSYDARPNENLARELLELFTLGEGNYSEKDITETARALTGWMIHYAGLGDETPFPELQQKAAEKGRSLFAFCDVPGYHDPGYKTILNTTKEFTGDEILELLALHPQTARHICGKLFAWFAYPDPEERVVERLAKIFTDTGGQMKPLLRAIAESDEFWSEKAIRSKPKSPVDFIVPIYRQINIGEIMDTLQEQGEDGRVHPVLKGIGGGVGFLMLQQGLFLFYPPNVSGWDWDESWITSANQIARVQTADLLFRGEDENRPIAVHVANLIARDGSATTHAGVVEFVLGMFDADLSQEQKASVIAAAEATGPLPAPTDPERVSILLHEITKAVFFAPEFHLC